jgi:hypothetical protein
MDIIEDKQEGISVDDIRVLKGADIEADYSLLSLIGEG